MKVSVVCCTWNSAAHIEVCIQSLLAQDYGDIEFVFVDGGSEDGTLSHIAAFTRSKVLLRDVRGGVSRAMNEGLRASSGDVVAYLHGDDYYVRPDAVSIAVAAMRQSHAEWCFGRIMRLDQGTLEREAYRVPEYTAKRLLRANFIPHPAAFVMRSTLHEVGGFNESLRFAMDYDLWLRLAKRSPPVQLDEYLAVFRVHPGSLSSSAPLATLREDLAVRRKYSRNGILETADQYMRFVSRLTHAWIRDKRR